MTATIARDRIRRSARGVEGAWIREIRARSVARTAVTPSPGPKTRRREAAGGLRLRAAALPECVS